MASGIAGQVNVLGFVLCLVNELTAVTGGSEFCTILHLESKKNKTPNSCP